jgi:arylsulfatase
VPLQAPKEWVEKYRKKFGDEEPYLGDHGYFPCRYPRATYAAMISFMDWELGDLIKTLKKQGLYDNTLIIFTSDNGPTYAGGVDFEFFESSKPFRNGYGHTKGFVYEGGIRVPMIASWPGKIKEGSESDLISVFYDYLPTLCDVADVEVPVATDGISFENELTGKHQKKHEYLYWEFPEYQGQQAVRMDSWKAVRKNIHKGNMHVELYDLNRDIKEEKDVSEAEPKLVKKMENIMRKEHVPSPIDRFKMKQLGDE